MISLNVSTTIHQPIKQVFNFVSAPENDVKWQYGTLMASRLPDGVDKLGSFFRSTGHLLGRRNQGLFEVTEYELNSKYSFKSLSGPLYIQTSYSFESTSGSTKINISIQASADDSFKISERLMQRKMKKQLKENLILLKHLLEAKSFLLGDTVIS